MKQVEWDRMIPDIRSNFPEPSVDRRDGSKDPKDAEPPLTAQAMAAKEIAEQEDTAEKNLIDYDQDNLVALSHYVNTI